MGPSTTPAKNERRRSGVTQVRSASYSAAPVSPQRKRTAALGIILGLVIGFGSAVLRESLDTRVRSAEDVVELADKPVLGAIGFDATAKDRQLITDIDSHAPRAEAFRVLRTNLQFIDVDTANKVFVLSSAVPGEGKTSTAVNLSISLAQAGVRTLLIEGDLRRPRAAKALGLDGIVGVTSVLVGKVKLDDALQQHEPSRLEFLASGPVPPNPAELLQSNAMRDLMTTVKARYDVVIIDAPPLLPVTDAALLAREADGAIVVVRHGKTTRDQVRGAVERLSQVDASLLGVVMNMTPAKGGGYGYGYGYAPEDSESRV
jgi:receptor protein-tyrosine kinase